MKKYVGTYPEGKIYHYTKENGNEVSIWEGDGKENSVLKEQVFIPHYHMVAKIFYGNGQLKAKGVAIKGGWSDDYDLFRIGKWIEYDEKTMVY